MFEERPLTILAKLSRGSFWITGSRIASNGLSAVSVFILARYLDPSAFGLVLIGTSVAAVLTAATELSTSNALIALSCPSKNHYDSAWTLGVIRGLFLASGVAVFAPYVAEMYGDPRLVEVLTSMGLLPLVSSLRSPYLARLERDLVFHQIFYMDLVFSVTTFITSILIAVMTGSYWSLIAGTILGTGAATLASFVLAPYRPHFSLRSWKELIGFSAWVSVAQLVSTLNYRFDQLIVGWYLGKVELGLYAVGGRIAQLPGREATRPLVSTLFAAYSTVREDRVRLEGMYRRSQNFIAAVAFPVSAFTAIIADSLVRCLMGDQWSEVVMVIQVLAVVVMLETFGSLVEPLALSSGQQRALVLREAQKITLRIPLLIAGTLAGGFQGLIYARALAGVLCVFIDMSIVRRILDLGLPKQFFDSWRVIVSTAVMAIGLSLMKLIVFSPSGLLDFFGWLAMLIVSGGMMYIASILFLWERCGRPDGAEHDFVRLLRNVRTRT